MKVFEVLFSAFEVIPYESLSERGVVLLATVAGLALAITGHVLLRVPDPTEGEILSLGASVAAVAGLLLSVLHLRRNRDEWALGFACLVVNAGVATAPLVL